ncbi:MAG: 1-deoxy-D-xylulose-5-phosphate reductoisomerase, partial [Sedimenticolaceae bacterium]
MKGVAILGSTGSIGVSTLDVVARHPDLYRVVALSANTDVRGILAQCREFRPELAAMADPGSARSLKDALAAEGIGTEVMAGSAGLEAVATHPDASDLM